MSSLNKYTYFCTNCGPLTRVFLNAKDTPLSSRLHNIFWGVSEEGEPALFGVTGTPEGMTTVGAMQVARRLLTEWEWKHKAMYCEHCEKPAELKIEKLRKRPKNKENEGSGNDAADSDSSSSFRRVFRDSMV